MQEGRRWKLKPCSLIKTGVNFFSPSPRSKELFTMATGEHRRGSEPRASENIRCVYVLQRIPALLQTQGNSLCVFFSAELGYSCGALHRISHL